MCREVFLLLFCEWNKRVLSVSIITGERAGVLEDKLRAAMISYMHFSRGSEWDKNTDNILYSRFKLELLTINICAIRMFYPKFWNYARVT